MTEKSENYGPLKGLNVIDFGHYYAGPIAAMLLADQGANVLRIVSPGKTELSEQQWRVINRNKKLLMVDLKTEEGKSQALSLIERADVLIENFRPGVMQRLGLDFASVKAINPALIYLSLPGFASTDSERANTQAWEGILSAATGVYTDTSMSRYLLGYLPVYTDIPQCSVYGATHGVVAILSALIARETSGIGTIIEVPLVEAGISVFGSNFTFKAYGCGLTQYRIDHPKAKRLENRELPAERKADIYSPNDSEEQQEEKLFRASAGYAAIPFLKPYPCADGRQLLIWIHSGDRVEKFLKALGIYDRLLTEDCLLEVTLGDPFRAYASMSDERKQRLDRIIEEALLAKTAQEWENQLSRFAVVMVRTREEWLALTPLMTSGLLTRMDDGNTAITVPGRFASVEGPEGGQPDRVDEPNVISASQAEAYFPQRQIKTPVSVTPGLKKGDLLQDLKVLDLSNIVAGPMSSYTLAQYGADVIKLDPLNTTLLAQMASLDYGQGKRSVLVDLKTAPGQDVFHKLLVWADVVIHNALDDVAGRLGVSREQMQAINPNVICCQMTAFGGTQRGGWELHPGWEPIVQYATGTAALYGSLERPQIHGKTSCCDVLGGVGLAFSALLAVYQQRKTGYAAEARMSLAMANNLIQLPFMIAETCSSTDEINTDELDGTCSKRTSGQFAVGRSWNQRLYACLDGWIYVHATADRAEALAEIVAGQSCVEETALEACFLKRNCTDWLECLSQAEIPCHRVMSVTDIYDKIGVRKIDNEAANEIAAGVGALFCRDDHPIGFPIVTKAEDWVLVGEERTFKRLTPLPMYGQHTEEILTELGYDETQINKMVELKAVAKYLQGKSSDDAYI